MKLVFRCIYYDVRKPSLDWEVLSKIIGSTNVAKASLFKAITFLKW